MAKKSAPKAAQRPQAKQPAAPPPRAAPRRSSAFVMWSMVIMALLLPWILPTLVVVFFGMMPAIVALIIDRSRGKSGAITVAAMNFAGIFPYILKLWSKHQSLESAVTIIADIFALIVIYGAAGAGWLIFMTVPGTVASVF
ncbi:MAG: hypothetical protein FJX42_06805, partial [Alphaproteobacteria bacterium]|nr:hypothetical protein [Alphaproteobacteria bacterium]